MLRVTHDLFVRNAVPIGCGDEAGTHDADELGALQCTGEPNREESAIPKARQIIAADPNQPPYLRRGQWGGSSGRIAGCRVSKGCLAIRCARAMAATRR
jgi:hypothetical protein